MIEDLLEYLGVEDIRPLGMEVQARCPMHEKRTGEQELRTDHWSINRGSGAHHCLWNETRPAPEIVQTGRISFEKGVGTS